jgi:hypothetical protein
MNKETELSLACAMSMHDTCKINVEDVRKCGCNCHQQQSHFIPVVFEMS